MVSNTVLFSLMPKKLNPPMTQFRDIIKIMNFCCNWFEISSNRPQSQLINWSLDKNTVKSVKFRFKKYHIFQNGTKFGKFVFTFCKAFSGKLLPAEIKLISGQWTLFFINRLHLKFLITTV